jgi:hypothetical protein
MRAGAPPQPNETRLMQKVRTALQVQLAPDVLARHLATGAVLGRQQLYERIASALR